MLVIIRMISVIRVQNNNTRVIFEHQLIESNE